MSKIDQQAFAWVVRERLRGLGEAEMAAFDAWFQADTRHQGAYARAMAIHNAIHLATGNHTFPVQADEAENGYTEKDDSPPALRRRKLLLGGLAAGLAAVLGPYGYSVLQAGTALTTAKGEFRRIPLQDHSIADINSDSRIDVAFTEQQRSINLRQGEAWFEVARDKSKPFIVEAGDALIRAVGTAFSVRRLATGSEVLVSEGTVEVWSKNDTVQRRLVTAGEHAFLAHDAKAIPVTRQPDEVNRRLAWREGKLILASQTLSEAVADFNRYSAKTMVIADPALLDKRLIGQYQLDAPELFAQDVSLILNVPLVITAERILIGQEHDAQPREM